VKLSVRSIARSILRCRNLKQRNQTVILGSLNVGKQSKDSRKIWISCYEILSNEILRNYDSELRIWNVLSGVETINFSMLKVSIISTGKKTLSLIISDIWTVHMFYTGSWLSRYLSQWVTINFELNLQFHL
jgi:hypothetical protein